MTKLVDLSEKVYGRLTVISRDGTLYGKVAWLCKCECGIELKVCGADLKGGNKSSCGCLKVETTKMINYSHGMTESPEYKIWCNVKERCLNPNSKNYSDYGGRGISICPKWRHSFEAFYKDMGPRPSIHHSIERENNNAGYSPGNCKWATKTEQARNKRNNHIVEFNGEQMCIAALADKVGKPYSLIYKRITRFRWPVELAVL